MYRQERHDVVHWQSVTHPVRLTSLNRGLVVFRLTQVLALGLELANYMRSLTL